MVYFEPLVAEKNITFWLEETVFFLEWREYVLMCVFYSGNRLLY